MGIEKEIVISARALGQWLNYMAYRVADGEINKDKADRAKEVRKAKAKILVEFESAAMSAPTAQEMLFRISTRAGRLLQSDAPASATRYMDAANSGEIDAKEALHLLVAYMRLRSDNIKELAEVPAKATGDQILPVMQSDDEDADDSD